MEPHTVQITLGDMAKISLGSHKLTKDHMSLLHILLKILLRKLDCENEIVCLSGFPAQCLKELLHKSQDPKIQAIFQDNTTFLEKYALINKLESKRKQLDLKLEKHYDGIRKNCRTSEYATRLWSVYSPPDEDLYSEHNPDYARLGMFLTHPTFNNALRHRITGPVLKRMAELEQLLDKMNKKLKSINSRSDEVVEHLELLGPLISEIEYIRGKIDSQWRDVRYAMTETEDMLTCKLDRSTDTALRKYVQNRIREARNSLAPIVKSSKQIRVQKKIEISSKHICLSCGPRKHKKSQTVIRLLPDACTCESQISDLTLLQKMDRFRVKSYRVTPLTWSSGTLTDLRSSNELSGEYADFSQSYLSTKFNKHRQSRQLNSLITIVERSQSEQKGRISRKKSISLMTQM